MTRAAKEAGAGHELFIYYRVQEERADALRAALTTLRARLLGEHPRLRIRLLCRPDTDDKGLQTWMETYATDEGVTTALRERIDALAQALVQPLIEGERHTETFRPCAW